MEAYQLALTPKQRIAVEALVTTGNVTEAARQAGVKRKTVYRWQASNEAFILALRAAEAEAISALARRMASLAELATEALSDALKDDDLKLRLRAADIYLQRLIQIRQHGVLEDRMTALEQQLGLGGRL